MKNQYGNSNKLKVNRDFFEEEITRNKKNNIHSIIQDINIRKKLNIYSSYSTNYRREGKKKEFNKNLSKNSFSNSNNYLMNYQSNKTSNINSNHLLFDSNKQRIINPGDNNFVQFKPSNRNRRLIRYTNLKNYGKISLKSIFLNKANNLSNEDKYEKAINNLKNYSRKNTINNSRNNNSVNNNMTVSYHQNIFNNFSNKKDKVKDKSINNSLNICLCYNQIKIPSIQHKNHYVYNISNIKTEVSSKDYSLNHSQSTNKKNKNNYLKNNIVIDNNNNNHMNETNNKNNSNIKNKDDKNLLKKNTSSYLTHIYSSPDTINNNHLRNKLHLKENKTNNTIMKEKLTIPMVLNIKNTSKEKLSRIKRIIEKNSSNHNSHQLLGFLKNYSGNKTIKSVDKKHVIKRQNDLYKKYIFKKKKILSLKENSKDGTINIIVNKNIKDNTSQIQPSGKTHNLFVHKKTNNLPDKLNIKEINKGYYNLKKHNVYKTDMNIYNYNNNIEDTINLSNSKKCNISISSKNKKNEEKSLVLPFFIEQFNLYYDICSKQLIINNKNKKNDVNHESDDEEFLLTKEILLLKKGLAKKSELSKEIRRKMRDFRIKRIDEFSLFRIGCKKIYKKKTGNYKNYRF